MVPKFNLRIFARFMENNYAEIVCLDEMGKYETARFNALKSVNL